MTINLKKQEIRHYHHRVCVLLKEFTFFYYLIMCTSERERKRKSPSVYNPFTIAYKYCPHTENDVRYLSFGHDLQFFKVLSIDLRFRVCDKCWYYVTAYFVRNESTYGNSSFILCRFCRFVVQVEERETIQFNKFIFFCLAFYIYKLGFMNNSRYGWDKNHIHQREKTSRVVRGRRK